MSNSGNRQQIKVINSVDTANINETVYTFGDTTAAHNANTGIERNGGITNLYETEKLLGDGVFIYSDDSEVISAKPTADRIDISIDDKVIGNLSGYGVEYKKEVSGAYNDMLLTDIDTYITCALNGNIVKVEEFSMDGVSIRSKETDYVNLTVALKGFTSLSFVRRNGISYDDVQEFGLRLGDQFVILKEDNPTEDGTPAVYDTLVGDLFQEQVVDSYCDVFKYENDLYSVGLVGNNMNRWFVLNNVTNALITNFGKYAWQQTQAGYTRHILTEEPRIDGGTNKVISLQGYWNFILFESVQQYQADAHGDVSSHLSSQIGWNYAELTYKRTSPTDIYLLYGPLNVKDTEFLFDTYQTNTDTLVSAYGKLSGGAGALSTKPFEFRLNWIPAGGGTQSYISVGEIDNEADDTLGSILTDIGAFDTTYTPYIKGDDTIMYKYDNTFKIIKISTDIKNRFEKLNGRLYKINTISALNVLDTFNSSLNVGSMDFNGRAMFNSVAVPVSEQTKVVSFMSGRYSNSVDVGTKFVSIPSFTSANIEIIAYRIANVQNAPSDFKADTFVNDEYAFTTSNNGLELVDTDPDDPFYIASTILPIPLGSTYDGNVCINNRLTLFLEDEYDGYQIGNDITGTYESFILYGQPYLFDGINIYQALFSGSLLSSKDKLANAVGMKLIATSPTEAMFLSDFDNSLYSFTGGRKLTKSMRLTNEDEITSGIWSTRDSSYLFDTNSSLIWMRDNIVSRNYKLQEQIGELQLYNTSTGIFMQGDYLNELLVSESYSWNYSYLNLPGSTIVPLKLQTAYFGQGINQKSMLQSFIVTIYNREREKQIIKLTIDTFDEDEQYTQSENITVNHNDYTNKGYAIVRIQPKHQTQLATSLTIESDEKILIKQIDVTFVNSVNAVINKKQSR